MVHDRGKQGYFLPGDPTSLMLPFSFIPRLRSIVLAMQGHLTQSAFNICRILCFHELFKLLCCNCAKRCSALCELSGDPIVFATSLKSSPFQEPRWHSRHLQNDRFWLNMAFASKLATLAEFGPIWDKFGGDLANLAESGQTSAERKPIVCRSRANPGLYPCPHRGQFGRTNEVQDSLAQEMVTQQRCSGLSKLGSDRAGSVRQGHLVSNLCEEAPVRNERNP